MNCPNPQFKIAGIPDEAKFCQNCGALLEKAKNTTTKKYYTFDELNNEKKSS